MTTLTQPVLCFLSVLVHNIFSSKHTFGTIDHESTKESDRVILSKMT